MRGQLCVYRCENGQLAVNEDYVAEQLAALPPETDDATRAHHERALANSVSPCPACRPEQYDLWRGGHFDPNHDCEDCRARRVKRRTAKPKAEAKT